MLANMICGGNQPNRVGPISAGFRLFELFQGS